MVHICRAARPTSPWLRTGGHVHRTWRRCIERTRCTKPIEPCTAQSRQATDQLPCSVPLTPKPAGPGVVVVPRVGRRPPACLHFLNLLRPLADVVTTTQVMDVFLLVVLYSYILYVRSMLIFEPIYVSYVNL